MCPVVRILLKHPLTGDVDYDIELIRRSPRSVHKLLTDKSARYTMRSECTKRCCLAVGISRNNLMKLRHLDSLGAEVVKPRRCERLLIWS